MEPLDYHDRFDEALQRAFAASSPAVRRAYFELADFYREKLGGRANMQPSTQLLKKKALVRSGQKDVRPQFSS
jgi:hypothetical protein